MIINNQVNNIIKTGENSSKVAEINKGKLAKLQYLLTKGLYKDPIKATIIEWTNNGIDSVRQSGKDPIANPVIVKVTDNSFSVEDKGLGLSKSDFETICMSYLTSTKEEDNNAIGAFGIGLKSFMALERSATFTCRKDGKECKFIAYQGSEFMEYDCLYEKDTTEENGVTAEISIDYIEASKFKYNSEKYLAYYDTVVLYHGEKLINNNILRSEYWQYSENADNNILHLCLKDVYYDIDYNKLGIDRIYMPIALRFELSDGLCPTPSREDLIYNDHTIKLIKERISKVADYFITQYNKTIKEYDTIYDCWNKIIIGSYYVTLNKVQFSINHLLDYSSKSINEISVKNIKFKSLEYYYRNRINFEDEYDKIGFYNGRTYQNKRLHSKFEVIDSTDNKLIVNQAPVGKVKTYLIEKYGNKNIWFIKPKSKKTLFYDRVGYSWEDKSYSSILGLKNCPKSEWRDRIKEYQLVKSQVTKDFIDVTNVENSKEFLDWCQERKEIAKENRKNKVYSNDYKVLNKQEDEVTLAYSRAKSIGEGYTFEKNTYKIKNLHKNPYLTLMFLPEEKDLAASLVKSFYTKKVNLAIVGVREQEKVKDIHNFKTFKQFMTTSKVFKRAVTAELFSRTIKDFKKIYDNEAINVIKQVLEPFKKDLEVLEEYVNNNHIRIYDDELLQSMMAVANENNLWDMIHWEEYNRVKDNIKKYSFLTYFKNFKYSDEETIKEAKSLINQIIYHQKMYKGLHDDLEIIVQPKEVLAEI